LSEVRVELKLSGALEDETESVAVIGPWKLLARCFRSIQVTSPLMV
jgi:hypothetical protein